MKNSDTFCRTYCALLTRYIVIIDDAMRLSITKDPLSSNPRLSLENLHWMSREALGQVETWPQDKINRWLGFIQGCLAMRGMIDVDEERDISRPLFHALYSEQERIIPERSERDRQGS